MRINHKIKIISGGQTGVDRAALDFCLENNFPCGGWCPKDRWAEDGPISIKYPLQETNSSDPTDRTRLNIKAVEATLILSDGFFDKGTQQTIDFLEQENKSYLSINLDKDYDMEKTSNWIKNNAKETLNITGPRESNAPGIYKKTINFLSKLFL